MDGDDKYLTANFIWENFYNGQQIDAEKSNQLVRELLQLKSESTKHNQFKEIKFIVDRLGTGYHGNTMNNLCPEID